MNDDELTAILRSGDTRTELPAATAGRIRAAMHDELDRTLDPRAQLISLDQAPTRTRRRGPLAWRVAAAAFVLMGVGAMLLVLDEVDTEPASRTDQPYLLACLDFIETTTVSDRPWSDLLAGSGNDNGLPADYFTTLADAIDRLVATSPDAARAASDLQLAAAAARRQSPDVGFIARQLERAQELLRTETNVACISARTDDS